MRDTITFLLVLLAAASWSHSQETGHIHHLAPETPDVELDGGIAKASFILGSAWDAHCHADDVKAIDLFQEVLSADASAQNQKAQALFGLGTAYAFGIGVEDIPKARGFFEELVARYPDDLASSYALIELGILAGRATFEQRQAARDYFTRAVDHAPGSLASHEAVIRLANMCIHELDDDLNRKGIDTLESHLQEYPDNPLAYLMHFRLAYWYQDMKRDYQNGLKHSLLAAELGMCDPKRQAMVCWNIAQIYRLREGNLQEALKWYQKIVEEFPREYFVFPAKRAATEVQEQLKDNPN